MKAVFSCAVASAALTSACFGIASPANANSYEWTYTGTTVDAVLNGAVAPVSGSGLLTTNAADDLVIQMSGNWSSPPDTTGLSSTSVTIDPPDDPALGNDNVIFPGNAILLNDNGLGFAVGLSLLVDIYYLAPGGLAAGYYTVDCTADCAGANPVSGNNDFGTFTLTQLDATTPLPAALALFAGGLGMFGLIAGRKKRKVAGPLAA